MKVIVGLGNPGKEYEKTRHNLGFRALDTLADKLNIEVKKEKMHGLIGEGKAFGEKVMLVKPTTFMNLSGDCVGEILRYYKLLPQDLIVIYDDIDIELGKIRIKPSGKSGTHNGMRDITNKISSEDFIRIRIGSGRPENGQNLADFVLGTFNKEQDELVSKAIENAADGAIAILEKDIHFAMNKFN